MTTNTSLVNLALQSFGSRTTVTAAELAASSTNEAIQANLTFANTRDSLLRMAPWDCAMRTLNLQYITSVPGTTENSSPATALWQPGQPSPPWAYEYQYPVDCLRACWITPSSQTGFTGVPITTAVTGSTPTTWLGGAIRFKVAIDLFYTVVTATVVNGGTGYAVGDAIFTALGPTSSPPIGGSALLIVLTAPAGVVGTVVAVSQVIDSPAIQAGSFFSIPTNPVGQESTTGSGTGATFNLTFNAAQSPQRVILTNQQYAILNYVSQNTDPNVWDPLFQDAFVNSLGADMCMALTGDKALANGLRQLANHTIMEARQVDGNEGLTINDVVPDWIRVRGVGFDSQYLGPNNGYDWGGMLPLFA